MAIPVIIDCDPGIDDVMALLLAFSCPEIDVRLITTEAGNQTQDKTSYNARAFVSYLNREVEVARGLEQPFFRELQVAEHVHGESGVGNLVFPEPTFPESGRTAIRALYDTIMDSPEPVILIATGPLTNIGALFLAHPEVKANVRSISFMGGAAVGGNMMPTAEFNVFIDPHAADIVFRSGVPIVMSGLDVTHKAFLTQDDLDEIKAIGSEMAGNLVELLRFYGGAAVGTPFHESHYADVIRLHDLCAVAYVAKPELFQGVDCYVAIETEGKLTAGTTVVDYAQRQTHEKNVHVLHTVDRKKFVRMFIEAIRNTKTI